jgi:ABC-type transport system substrate-binding protein
MIRPAACALLAASLAWAHPGAAQSPARTPLQNGGKTLVVAALHVPGGFDGDALKPGTVEVISQVYEGLTKYARKQRPDGTFVLDAATIEPDLAESWTVSPDGRDYVFKLREGVTSAAGHELVADDVVWGWQKSWAQKRTGVFMAQVSNVTGVTAVSKYAVKFTLRAPSEIFLRALSTYVPGIYDSVEMTSHATTEDPWALKWLDGHVAGYGPYTLDSLTPDQQAVFVVNPHYFGPRPFYTRVVYQQIPSPSVRLQLLRTGNVQFAEYLTEQQNVDLMKDSNFFVDREVGSIMAAVRMNADFKPFDDLRVRQALAYATDYAAINRAVFAGLGVRARSLVPPMLPGSLPDAYMFETDIPRARALLAEAGHPDGIDITYTYGDELWFEEALGIQLQQEFAKAGIRLKLDHRTGGEVRAASAARRIAFFAFRDSPFVLDPFYKLYLDAHPDGANNRNDFHDPAFTRAVDAGLSEGDHDRRLQLAAEAQRIHADDVSWIYLWYPGFQQALPACMKGYTWYPDYAPRWKDLSCQN